MSQHPRHSRPRHKLRPKPRPRLFMTTPLPLSHTSVEAQWTPRQITLEEVLMDFSLPQIVQCRTPVLRSRDDPPLAVPLDKPILLADQRTARHLLARIVKYDERSETFHESADSVVIPEDYEGHFLRLQSRTTKDKSHVQSLENIANDDTAAFLNLTNLTSFPASRGPKDKSRLVYTVGNVFLVDEPLPPNSSHADNSAASSGISQKGKSVNSGSSGRSNHGLMRCLDERGEAVLVPTNQAGEMVSILKNGEDNPKLSVKSSDMIATEKFPLLTRYAYGKKQPRLTDFTKLFTLLDSFQETSIIACILDGHTFMLLEIPVTSSLQFQVALNSDEILKIPRMRRALEACKTRGLELSRDIKFKYKFAHRVQETSRRMMKLKEDDLPSATVRTRLLVAETYLYI